MIVLALDTATRQGSAALWIDGACESRRGDLRRTHGERLPAELLALLGARDLTPADVDRFAVIAGPGSFTGLRVGIAAIQGLALVTGRRVVPIPTLEAMAEAWRTALGTPEPSPPETSAPVNPGTPEPRHPTTRFIMSCLDGQRGDVFFAGWRVDVARPIDEARSVIEPAVGTPADLVRRVEAFDADGPPLLIGIGLDRHADALRPLRASVVPLNAPLAAIAAAMAAGRPASAVPPHALRPIYIRRPDAVLARERAGLVP